MILLVVLALILGYAIGYWHAAIRERDRLLALAKLIEEKIAHRR